MIIRLAIIGLGAISDYYIAAIQNNRQYRLVALADLNKERKPKSIGNDISFYTDYRAMLNNEKLDSVMVLTPNNTHFAIVSDCLKRSLHVLCEKPLGINFKETAALVHLAKEERRLLYTAFHRRFNNALTAIKLEVEQKQIVAVHARYLEDIVKHSRGEQWYFDIGKSGGGCVLDNGTNVFNALIQIVGDVELVFAHVGKRGEIQAQYDANAYILLSNQNNCKISVELDWHFMGEKKDLTIYFVDGTVTVVDFLADFKEFKDSLWHEYVGVLTDFLRAIEDGNVNESLAVLLVSKLVDEAYSSS